MASVFRNVKNQLYELDFFREPAYADKAQSNTRLVFTLILLILTGGAFAGFFVYKAFNRATITQNILPEKGSKYVAYEAYQKVVGKEQKASAGGKYIFEEMRWADRQSGEDSTGEDSSGEDSGEDTGDTLDSSVTCTTTKIVSYYEIARLYADQTVNPFESDATKTALLNSATDYCSATYPTVPLHIQACASSAIDAFKFIEEGTIQPGSLYDYDALDQVLLDATFSIGFNEYISLYNSVDLSSQTIRSLVDGGFITGTQASVDTYLDNLDTIINGDDFFNVTISGGDQIYLNIILDHQDYFETAKVTSCQYLEKEGWFVVFNYSLNSTQSLLAVFLFIAGLIYGFTKKFQSVRKSRRGIDPEAKEGESSAVVEMKVAETVVAEKTEEKHESKKSESSSDSD